MTVDEWDHEAWVECRHSTHMDFPIEEPLENARHALNDVLPEDHPDRPWWYNFLGILLEERHLKTGLAADLDESIEVTKKGLDLIPNNHPERERRLLCLAWRLDRRHLKTETSDDLEEGILTGRNALNIINQDHPNWSWWSNYLATQLHRRYYTKGRIFDLEESIQLQRQAIEPLSADHLYYKGWLTNLGTRLHERYLATGAMADIQEAIQITRQAANAMSKDDPSWAISRTDLGNLLADRHEKTGAVSDLEEALRVSKEALEATPQVNKLARSSRLSNLGAILHNKFQRTQMIADVDEAIKFTREAIDLTPAYIDGLINLGAQATAKFQLTKSLSDLEEAIRVTSQAIDAAPKNHPERPGWLSNLATQLNSRYIEVGDERDLDRATLLMREAVEVTPNDHPGRTGILNNLGVQLLCRHKITQDEAHLEEAMLCFRLALRQPNGHILSRIETSRIIIRTSTLTANWQQAYDAADYAIRLMPRILTRSLKSTDKQHLLGQVVGFASDAAAVALELGKSPFIAIDFLEQGRGILAASLEETRSDISHLQDKHPKLAQQLSALRSELEVSVARSNILTNMNGQGMSPNSHHPQSRPEAGEEFDKLIVEIRKLPGFEAFLLPPRHEDLLTAAKYGPIVFINTSKYRCDALLVQEQQVQTLALPKLNTEDIEMIDREGNLGRLEVLEWLWDAIASPILDFLGITKQPAGDHFPRVWWIATGALSRFPLHAAGRHNLDTSQSVLDRVISSYSSSIQAIIHGRSQQQKSQVTPGKALFIAMRDTAEHSRLPYVDQEIKALKDICQSMELTPVEPARRKQDVISSLPSCKIFHFAGHGHTHNDDPSRSQLLLEDWKTDSLTVADLLDLNLRTHSPFLAYLSACGTGRIKDKRFVDESIHLISAFQLAGFRHVIGTLWEVDDQSCVGIAKITYEMMRDGGMTDLSVSQGLHRAARELRTQSLEASTCPQPRNREDEPSLHEDRGLRRVDRNQRDPLLPRDVVSCDEDETIPLHWIPYVHFGV